MRTFDFTNGKQFPETLHVSKSVPYDILWCLPREYALCMWRGPIFCFIKYYRHKFPDYSHYKIYQESTYNVLEEFMEFVYERVPIYFVNKKQTGTIIEVQETAYYSVYDTVVPDNHIIKPLISKEEVDCGCKSWEERFRPHIERMKEYDSPYSDENLFDQEIFPDWDESDNTMVEVEVDALYCPTGGAPECQESNPEIFIYMDYFVDSNGNPTRPSKYMAYVIAHELAHAMMDERLWEAFLCKNGHTLSKGIPHNSKRYYLFEEGLATAVGWYFVSCDAEVAQEIMKAGLPYSFGLSSFFYKKDADLLSKRISEWLFAKLSDPIPYL